MLRSAGANPGTNGVSPAFVQQTFRALERRLKWSDSEGDVDHAPPAGDGYPGNMWGETGFWRTAELKDGFRVTIVADQDRVMPLPETFDLSAFQGEKGKTQAKYIDEITRSWWGSESRGKRKRTYAHEIVVIAPADEPVMLAK